MKKLLIILIFFLACPAVAQPDFTASYNPYPHSEPDYYPHSVPTSPVYPSSPQPILTQSIAAPKKNREDFDSLIGQYQRPMTPIRADERETQNKTLMFLGNSCGC